MTAAPLESTLLSVSGQEKYGQYDTPSLSSHDMVQQGNSRVNVLRHPTLLNINCC